MIEKIINYLNESGQDKILFDPPIKIKMAPHSPIVFIDKIYKIKENYMVTIRTDNDSMNLNINVIDNTRLSSLSIRLYSMYGDKKEISSKK